MIDLDNVDFVLFDYDDTLCIHSKHEESKEFRRNINARILKEGIKAWDDCKPNNHMRKMMSECKERGIRMGLISTTLSCCHMMGKHDWVLAEYGVDLENYCVGSYEGKVTIMIAISDAFNIPRKRILFVDDSHSNLEAAFEAGFMVCTPMEVVNYIEERKYQCQ
jgi:beta-phosphoglucomutase-like phosphatase (HAD superfamily)